MDNATEKKLCEKIKSQGKKIGKLKAEIKELKELIDFQNPIEYDLKHKLLNEKLILSEDELISENIELTEENNILKSEILDLLSIIGDL